MAQDADRDSLLVALHKWLEQRPQHFTPDEIQETIARVIVHTRQAHTIGNLRGLAWTIAINVRRDEWRRTHVVYNEPDRAERRSAPRLEYDCQRQPPDESCDTIDETYDPLWEDSGPKAVAEASLQASMTVLLPAMTELQRKVIHLRYWHDCSRAEIASELGLSVAAVHAHHTRGLESLRVRARECEIDSSSAIPLSLLKRSEDAGGKPEQWTCRLCGWTIKAENP